MASAYHFVEIGKGIYIYVVNATMGNINYQGYF